MKDRFLRDHCATALVVDLGGRTHPISIRDQMTRGRLVVDRLRARDWIGKGRDLLVIGGGAAGATAAIYAAQQYGVTTWLIDREPDLFSLQSLCDSRLISPTQYDWPAEHWDEETLPPALPVAPSATGSVTARAGPRHSTTGLWKQPLPFDRHYADDLAVDWLTTVQAAELKYRHLKVYRNTELSGPLTRVTSSPAPTAVVKAGKFGHTARAAVFLRATFAAVDPGLMTVVPKPHDFGAVIYCRGHGAERCHAGRKWNSGQYRGFRFWESDPFADANVGLPAGTTPQVLISGGGDGALQDFIRLASGLPSAHDLYDRLAIPADWVAGLHGFDEQARLAYVYSQDEANDHQILSALHRQHERAAADVVRKVLAAPAMDAGWETLFTPRPLVQLAFPCDHFGICYALNRFLVLVIAQYLMAKFPARAKSTPPLIPHVNVDQVRPLHPAPCVDPASCHGLDHEITFAAAPLCYRAKPAATAKAAKAKPAKPTTAGASSPPAPVTANVVVLRHGLKFVAKGRPRLPVRQALPYYLYG